VSTYFDEKMFASEIIRRLDGRLTERMLDHWLRNEQIIIDGPVLTGSGGRRRFSEAEFRAIARMVETREIINEFNRRFSNGELWTEYIKEERDGT
jgi:hypothetical protein